MVTRTRSRATGVQAPPRLQHPAEQPVEARAQTQHKLELADRYFKSWCSILAHAHGYDFCVSDMYVVDALAGRGMHQSETDPDGQVPGTPLLAARAARHTQQQHPDARVHVRAIELDRGRARELDLRLRRYAGLPPAGVDVLVLYGSFEDKISAIKYEIAQQDHPHSEGIGHNHGHRSLWLFDPYGWMQIPHHPIASLGPGSEAIVNIDIGGFRRLAGVATGSSAEALASRSILDAAFGSSRWRSLVGNPAQAIAQGYADTFLGYRHRHVYPLRSSSSQERWVVQLTNSTTAVQAFARDYDTSMRAGTLIAGEVMTGPQRRIAAEAAWKAFRGEEVTIDDMFATGHGYSRSQLRAICGAAQDAGFGLFHSHDGLMEWFETRAVEPDLTLGL